VLETERLGHRPHLPRVAAGQDDRGTELPGTPRDELPGVAGRAVEQRDPVQGCTRPFWMA
jgi:hypothetical protein